jgi:tRNA threonylcarbamoyladenosine biosynthesis protein TsaE
MTPNPRSGVASETARSSSCEARDGGDVLIVKAAQRSRWETSRTHDATILLGFDINRVTGSPEETLALGKEIGQQLKPGDLICLFGELGAGKTTLIKGIVSEASGVSPDEVSSPTFVYHHIYDGARTVHHFDLYRLADADAFLELGFDEFFHTEGICCIEWAEKIETILPDSAIRVVASHTREGKREFAIDGL